LTWQLLTAGIIAQAVAWAGDAPATRDEAIYFETHVRPLLVEHCQGCHGPEKQKGGLRLDSRAGILAGGDSGPAIVPGDLGESLLVEAIRYEGLEMPPAGKLPEAKVAALTRWIERGAPWPGAAGEPVVQVRPSAAITAEDRGYWAFQPIARPEVPRLKRFAQPAQAIDALVLARLEAAGLEPNGAAPARKLVRRLYFDLIGLPPTPEEAESWTARLDGGPDDAREAAYADLIDQLLARPQYGERWGRHWLDVVRFGQTNGYERDAEKPLAWRYRDYVIRALNEDKPYDRFILEQLAGDELPDATPDSRIATAFYRLGIWDDEPDDRRQAEMDELDDVMVATGAAFLGLTLGCARCHDHKIDPIPQADYYRLLAFFRNVRPYANPGDPLESATLLPLSDDRALAAALERRQERAAELERRARAAVSPDERKRLEEERKGLGLEGIEWTLGVREPGTRPPATHVLIRGNAGSPGDEVQPGLPRVLGDDPLEIAVRDHPHFPSSGRRLALARWIASPSNPLTARVMANRVWHYHFGRGLVPTTADFGRAGEPPSHPELLDWLASELIAGGWSLKHLHRTILLSESYRRSSSAARAAALAADPDNKLLWRQKLRRLEAEVIRDTVLAVSGQLNLEAGGRGFFPRLGGEVLAGASRPGAGWEVSPAPQQCRRSVYTFIKRTLMAPMLETLDYANHAQPMAERPTTTVAPQALLLWNDRFMQQQAAALAARLVAEAGDDARAQIRRAYRLAVQRDPTPRELELAEQFLARERPRQVAQHARLTFHPNVPVSLHTSYLQQLDARDFLVGPAEGWTYARGRWAGGYEGILTVDPARGPLALWDAVRLADGVVTARVTLGAAAERAGLLVRGRIAGDLYQGYEVALDPRAGRMAVLRHGGRVDTLGERPLPAGATDRLPVRVELAGSTIRVAVGDSPTLVEVDDPQPLTDAGQVGLAAWGADVSVDELAVETAEGRWEVAPPDGQGQLAARRALQSLCLLVLNLNEMFYVD